MQWDPSLECGVELVDNEHKELFKMVGDLMQESKEGKSKEASGKALGFLGEYVVNHFAHEEALMRQCNYPYAEEHKQLHDTFVKTFHHLNEKFNKSNDSPAVIVEINHAAMSWLVNHIKVIDQRFTDYYKHNSN